MTEFNFDTVFDETMQTHNLDTVVILGHLNPDGDAAGSVIALRTISMSIIHNTGCFHILQKRWSAVRKRWSWKIRYLFLLRCRTYPENNIVS